MVKKWKGIKEIVEKATKELIEMQEDGYLFYSAPEGHKLILSVVIKESPPWKIEIKDIGIDINGRRDRIIYRRFSKGDERIITDDDEPLLEIVRNGNMEAEEIMRNIKEERKKARYRIQGRMFL